MKGKIQITITLFLICQTALFNAVFAQCESYTKEIKHDPDIRKKVYVQGPKSIMEYQGCPYGTLKKRNITFVHGLGGDASSWEKAATWTAANYETGVDKINYSGKGWESSFYSVSKEINSQIYSNTAGGINQDYPGRCKLDDYVIVHSQGGIAARHLDRYWDIHELGFGDRKFYGMVTFGVPHAGADIALTRDDHYAYIQKVISTVVVQGAYEAGYNITKKFGLFVGTKPIEFLEQLDTFIKDHISPLLVSSLHTQTLEEMRPGSQQMSWINNHTSRLRKVAFYGIEDEPECWRVMNDVVGTSSGSYPLFTAEEDEELMDKMERIRAHHVAKIAENDVLLKKWFYWHQVHVFLGDQKKKKTRMENVYRKRAIDFLDKANTEWRYLIGAYHVDSFEFVNETSYLVTAELKRAGQTVDVTTRSFPTKPQAEEFAQYIKQFAEYQTRVDRVTTSERRRKYFPNDGVVLAKSQVAFHGVHAKHVDKMEGDNHFQERNSPETGRVLKKLYRGGYDKFFLVDPK